MSICQCFGTPWRSCVVTRCDRNPPVTDGFHSQGDNDAEDRFLSCRHDGPRMCPDKLQWTIDISSDPLRPSCTALIAGIYLWLGLYKGTVSGLWRTVEIPIDQASLWCIAYEDFANLYFDLISPARSVKQSSLLHITFIYIYHLSRRYSK